MPSIRGEGAIRTFGERPEINAPLLGTMGRTIDRRIQRGELPEPDLSFRDGTKVWYMPTLERVNIRRVLFVENAA